MAYEFTYQYRYIYECNFQTTIDLFFCYSNGNCVVGDASWVSNGINVFSNSPLSSIGSCLDFTLVSSNYTNISCSDKSSSYYLDCSFTSGGGGGGSSGSGLIPPSSYEGNIIKSISGANLLLDDEALSSGVGEPMFFWYGQLLNVAITFIPVIVVISCFWLIYGWLKNLMNKNSLDSKKSLDNK